MTRVDNRNETGGQRRATRRQIEPRRTRAAGVAGGWCCGARFLGWMLDGVERAVFGLTPGRAGPEMIGPAAKTHRHRDPVLVAVLLSGAALGGVFFGWLGDSVGACGPWWSVDGRTRSSRRRATSRLAPVALGPPRFASSLGMAGNGRWASH